MKRDYEVRVDRIGHGDITVIVSARTLKEAEEKAIEAAKDVVLMETSSEYNVSSASELPIEKEYLVTWKIEIGASSPEVAADMALEIQRDTDSLATSFTVTNMKSGEEWEIDASIPTNVVEKYPMSDWRWEVTEGNTVLGYKEWVQHKEESANA